MACHSNRWKIDISKVEINQQISRFDKDLFVINPDSVWDYIPTLEEKYGGYFDLYNNAIVPIYRFGVYRVSL